jgi:hypothetical protein
MATEKVAKVFATRRAFSWKELAATVEKGLLLFRGLDRLDVGA